jgi:hypothetical protein
MVYNIQYYETNGGYATQLLVELQENFTTSDRGIIYYHLRNLDNSTQVFNMSIGDYSNLPYNIIFQEKIILEGTALAEVLSGIKKPLDIVLKKRPDIVISKKGFLLFDDCFGKELGEFYLDNEDFSKTSFIYTDEDLKKPIMYEGKISDNTSVGFYSPKSGLQELSLCK